MNQRRLIKCSGNVSVNVCNLKKNDILILQIPDNYDDLDAYENISTEAKRLADNLKDDLGFRIPVLVLAGDVTYKTMNRKELLSIISDD